MSQVSKYQEWVVDGADGAAKTPVLQLVSENLQRAGIRVATYAPFVRVNELRQFELAQKLEKPREELTREEQLSANIYELWGAGESNQWLAIKLLRNKIQQCRVEAEAEGVDVMLWDRHWITVFLEIHDLPACIELWGDDFPPAFVLTTTPDIISQRERFSVQVPWTRSREQMEGYLTLLAGLVASEYRRHIRSTFSIHSVRQDLTPIVSAITTTIIESLQGGRE